MAERPLLMDKQWENIQKKTFTKWVNSHMAKRGQTVTEFTSDFQDGLKLISFFEIISNKDIGSRYEKKPKMKIHFIQNVSTALKFLAEQKVKLVSISAEDIVDGNLKLILGMIWTIILRFQIEDISVEELSSRDALLLWCKKKSEGYRDCKVENFHTSWQDGMAFCAIIHKHRPDLIDYDSLSKNNPRENLKLAFDVAEKEFGIPQLLDLEDIVDIAKPDERSIITYVSQYYHYFSAGRKQEVAGRRIGKLVDMANSIEELKADYNDRAEKLAKWINDKTGAHKDHNFGDNGLAGIKDLIQQFNDYKEGEKLDKAAEKSALETLFNNIALKLRANNRGVFTPPAGTSVQDVQNLWDGLLGAERDRDDALRKELERQEKLDLLNRRFAQKADKLEAWIAAKEKYLAKEENVDSLNKAKERIKHHDAFYVEYADSKPRVAELEELAKEIAALNAPNADQVNNRTKNIKGRWEGLQGSADNKKENLRKKLEIQQRIEELRIDFAKLAKEYNRWVGTTIDHANDHTFGETLEDVQAYKSELDKENGANKSESAEKLQKLQSVWAQMQELGITDLKYTVLTIKDLETRGSQLDEAIKKREAAYEEEVRRQLLLEQKRKEFAAMASAFVEHLNQRRSQISSLEGEPEPLVEAVKKEYSEGAAENAKLDQIKAFNTELTELGINENKHTEYTPSILAKQSAQLGNFVRNYIQDLNEERDLKADFVNRAQKLIQWINSTLPQLSDRKSDNTLQGARERSAEFQQYKTGPKAEAAATKPEIERLFQTISNLLKKSNRPPFTPPAGSSLEDINAQWEVLEKSEADKEEALAKELFRQENLATLVRRFNSDSSDLDSWADEKGKYLAENPEITSLFKAQFEVKLFEAYGTEFKNRQPRFKQLEELKNQIGAENYSDQATIEARFNEIAGKLSGLETIAAKKSAYLQEQLAVQQKNENLRHEFARLAKDYNSWVKSSVDKIEDYNFGFTLDAVTSYKKDLTNSDNEYTTTADEKEAQIKNVTQELESRGVSDAAKHSQFTTDDIKSIRNNLQSALSARDAAHQEELKKQTTAEGYRKVFAGKATEFVNYLAGAKADLESTAGSSDEKIAAIKSKHNGGAVGKEKVSEVTTLGNQMKSEGVYGNAHTTYSVPGLVSRNNQHNLQVDNLLTGLTEEKEMQERITQQEAELKEHEKKENMVLDFNAKATALNQWIENADDNLNDPINVNSVEDAEKLSKEFAQLESQLAQKQADHDNLVALAQEMRSLNVNDFSGITPEELTEVFNKVKASAQERKVALQKELQTQKDNDALSQDFAKKATAFSQWVASQNQTLSNQKGDLDQQLNAIQSSRSAYEAKQNELKDLEKSSRALETAGVKRNKYTDLTHRILAAEYEGLGAATAKQETALTNEILAKKGSDISPEQINEIKEVFKHFDKNHDNSLGRLELKACLQALGDEPTESELDAIMKEVDPTNQGVTFQAFANLVSKRTKDTDSKEEIIKSFKEIANDKDFVTEIDLRKVMPNDKVAYLIANMPKYGEHGFDYKKWVEQQY